MWILNKDYSTAILNLFIETNNTDNYNNKLYYIVYCILINLIIWIL